MTTWADLQVHVRDRLDLTLDEDDRFATIVELAHGRSQRVEVLGFVLDGTEFARIKTPLCDEENLNRSKALERNATLTVGAYALEHGTYYLVQIYTLHRLTPSELVDELLRMAAYGDNIEERRAHGDSY